TPARPASARDPTNEDHHRRTKLAHSKRANVPRPPLYRAESPNMDHTLLDQRPAKARADRRLGARYSQSLLSGRRSAGLPVKEPIQEPTWTDFRRRPATPGDCQAWSSAH